MQVKVRVTDRKIGAIEERIYLYWYGTDLTKDFHSDDRFLFEIIGKKKEAT